MFTQNHKNQFICKDNVNKTTNKWMLWYVNDRVSRNQTTKLAELASSNAANPALLLQVNFSQQGYEHDDFQLRQSLCLLAWRCGSEGGRPAAAPSAGQVGILLQTSQLRTYSFCASIVFHHRSNHSEFWEVSSGRSLLRHSPWLQMRSGAAISPPLGLNSRGR